MDAAGDRQGSEAGRNSAFLRYFEGDGRVLKIISLHSLRYAPAVSTLDSGAYLNDLQKQLGHASIRTTRGLLAGWDQPPKEQLPEDVSLKCGPCKGSLRSICSGAIDQLAT